MPSCWIEVNLSAIQNNFRALQELAGEGVRLICVVKANAYGHGAIEVSRALRDAGAEYLAVTRIEEAVPIRQAGVSTPILLLAPAPADEVGEIVAHDLTACLNSYEDARLLSVAAQKQNKPARAQLKIDTGMNRFGVRAESAVSVARQIKELPQLQLEAAFTHFARAGGTAHDMTHVHAQFAVFQPLMRQVSHAVQISPTGFHCANSAAFLRFPAMRLSCSRVGTVLYGQFPSPVAEECATQQRLKLEDTWQAKARVLALREVMPGEAVGYGGEWTARKKSKIAVIGIGYADGFAQEPQTRREEGVKALRKHARNFARDTARTFGYGPPDAPRTVTIRGARAPIVGRIAMQTSTIDVTNIEGASVGDEVLVFLRRTSAGAHLPRKFQ